MRKSVFILIAVVFIIAIVLFYNTDLILKEESVIDHSLKFNYLDSIYKLDSTKDMDIFQLKMKFDNLEENYLELHYDAFLVDTHNDFIWQVYKKGVDFGRDNRSTQSDLPKLLEGGVDVQVFAIWIPTNKVRQSYSFTKGQIDRLRKIEEENSERFEIAESFEDMKKILEVKKVCGLIGIEGGTAIENNLDNINEFFNLGVRYIGLTWNNSNNIGTSAKDESKSGREGSLTEFGFEVVKRMDEVGMLIDVSHLGEGAFWDVIETTKNPIIASHSNCYAIHPHYRNLTDEQIKAIADGGGVIDVNFHNGFLGAATVDKIVDHIDYLKELVGVDYIGIGSDFDGGINAPADLYDATQYPEITRELVKRGYTEEEIRKILGLNFIRVFKQVCG
ncbi:dipeptidase [Bacteroidota bacterium]